MHLVLVEKENPLDGMRLVERGCRHERRNEPRQPLTNNDRPLREARPDLFDRVLARGRLPAPLPHPYGCVFYLTTSTSRTTLSRCLHVQRIVLKFKKSRRIL